MSASKVNLVLLAVIAVLGTVLVVDRIGRLGAPVPQAFAQPGQVAGPWMLGTTGNYTTSGPFCLWVLNTETSKLAVYQLQGNRLQLLFVRDIRFDLDATWSEWTQRGFITRPTVVNMKKELEKKKRSP